MPLLCEDGNSFIQEDDKPHAEATPCNEETTNLNKLDLQEASLVISPQEDNDSAKDISHALEKATTKGENEEHC
ncbi:hypothetical protein TNCT_358861 [Trichonephila clavata]|uniref:Uncharacterized protein n=1 Tax=Trichonephila clavata TaxID=2740835 RepID=A0A8X6KVF3_TRICU|nr:hypothetical protein TNCT_358861 [Trichonephila clavata]